MESDPIGLAAGLNTYSYVSNMPTTYVDPLGLFKIDNKVCAQFNGTVPLPQNSVGNSVFDTDLMEFLNPRQDTVVNKIPPPAGQTGKQFDANVRRVGDNYAQGKYNPIKGPNSNTSADNIPEFAGGVVPDVRGAQAQNYGERVNKGGVPFACKSCF